MPNILIINGALGGSSGNTAELLALAEEHLNQRAAVSHLELCREPALDRILDAARNADGLLFGTGTYWDSWGSPLQRFFEMTAHTEGQEMWLGKPAACVVTAHAVGAKSVLSRLFGVLNVYGMLIPPFAGLAYTYVNQVAYSQANEHLRNELWTADDVAVVSENLLQAINKESTWRQWPSNSGRYGDKWLYAYTEMHASCTKTRV